MGMRPLLRVVPAPVGAVGEECIMKLMTRNKEGNCSILEEVFPWVPQSKHKPISDKKVAANNFTCFSLTGSETPLGKVPLDWCESLTDIGPVFSLTI